MSYHPEIAIVSLGMVLVEGDTTFLKIYKKDECVTIITNTSIQTDNFKWFNNNVLR